MARESMIKLSRFFLIAMGLGWGAANAAAPVSQTVGSNLTAFNNGMGAINGAQWNALNNGRSVMGDGTAPAANFGNCNSLILRCAQPRCANGGCTDMNVATSIVAGCVNSSSECKKHGDALVQYLAAQMVANSTAAVNQANAAAASAAAAAAQQQSAEQLQAMQAQIQQMAAQNAQQQQQFQETLAAQQAATAQAVSDALAAQAAAQQEAQSSSATISSDSGGVMDALNSTQQVAVANGVSADVLARAQISGEILSGLENAQKNLDTLYATMKVAFDYAGCDDRGGNCTGPKRVKKFKELANAFFKPYEDALDELYDSLILAQSVGVDLTNIYFLLNDSCNQWAYYMCDSGSNADGWPRYSGDSCKNGKSVAGGHDLNWTTTVRGGHDCGENQVIPAEDDRSCTMFRAIKQSDDDGVKRGYLFADEGENDEHIRVGCISSALDNSWLFQNRKSTNKARVSSEVLKRILAQDALNTSSRRAGLSSAGDELINSAVKYCAVTEQDYMNLEKYAMMGTLPNKNICINERNLDRKIVNSYYVGFMDSQTLIDVAKDRCEKQTGTKQNPGEWSDTLNRCFCEKDTDGGCKSPDSKTAKTNAENAKYKNDER